MTHGDRAMKKFYRHCSSIAYPVSSLSVMDFSTLGPITLPGLVATLYAVVAVMILIVLYHVLFIVVDLRKILRRFEETTEQVENVLLKPLNMIDEVFTWILQYLGSGKKQKKNKAKESEVGFDVQDI
jgi:hypothetical protein